MKTIINTIMITQKQILRLRAINVDYYLSKPKWTKTYGDKWENKVSQLKSSNKTHWKSSNKTSTSDNFKLSKTYALHSVVDDSVIMKSVSLEDITMIKKMGIVILSEKNGVTF